MDHLESNELCARLVGSVGGVSAETVYDNLNLVNTQFSEFSLSEMLEIFDLEGMRQWPETNSASLLNQQLEYPSPPMSFSLVCFQPPNCFTSSTRNPTDTRISAAHEKASAMFRDCFDSEEDHDAIDVALSNFPTMAIFMSQISTPEGKKKSNSPGKRSIFDVADLSAVHCLSAVNYFRDGTHTQVLWLATTIEAPPINSIHVTWRQHGLCTYLLCMLVKQHTGIGNGNLDRSVLSLQASRLKSNPARSFYLKLGFISHDEYRDNGLSHTSAGFQAAVKDFPMLWVPVEREKMSFLKLCQGRLKLSVATIDLTESDPNLGIVTWKQYGYATFPWPFPSMKRVEGFLDSRPILRGLSGGPLPITDRPLRPQKSLSRLSGKITGERRGLLNTTSWLATDEIQFLLAFLMRNPESISGWFHVLGPWILDTLSTIYDIQEQAKRNNGVVPRKFVKKYNYNVGKVRDYIESRLDILEHKFIVFVCNVNQSHWVSIVVVNPFLVFDRYVAEVNDDVSDEAASSNDEDFCGWCVLDSLGETAKRGKDKGFHGTCATINKASFGVRLFLNICASYLKAKRRNEESSEEENDFFCYDEPFGSFDESGGTVEFPRFDFPFPSIIQQWNGYDCGLAVVANSMAIMIHLKHVKFMKSQMDVREQRLPANVVFFLREDVYSLKNFWQKLMDDSARTRHGEISNSENLLQFMRQELIEIVDEIAEETATDSGLLNQIKEVVNANLTPGIVVNIDYNDGGSETSVAASEITSTRKDAAKTVLSLRRCAILHPTAAVKDPVDSLPNEPDHAQRCAILPPTAAGKEPVSSLPNEPDHAQPNRFPTVCHAGPLCRWDTENVVIKGTGQNGSPCCECHLTFHHVCLFLFKGQMYCINCYKQNVVCKCSAETLFEDLLVVSEKQRGAAGQRGPMHTATQLEKFIDNFLEINGLDMNFRQFRKWKRQSTKWKASENKSAEARKKYSHKAALNQSKREKYEKVIQLAKEEWLLSTDGVVKELRYRAKQQHFVARVHYKRGTRVVEEVMIVPDDWVIDTYGKELANKLIDRDENSNFILPVNEEGMLAIIQVDERKITRVRYHPGNDGSGIWKGLLDNGKQLPIAEDMVYEHFGERFVKECKKYGTGKFISIPVGMNKSSLMNIFPQWTCENAPPIKFMQGEIDSCVFSSLASAFYQTSIPDLVTVANVLQTKSTKFCGGAKSIYAARCIVQENLKWLQVKRVPMNFDWKNDITDYMFVVGVIKDSTNCCQHAVTIFRNWIYDSNEPFALPLSKESLDLCTWEIRDGAIDQTSSFVSFVNGYIFYEEERKKRKVLDWVPPRNQTKSKKRRIG